MERPNEFNKKYPNLQKINVNNTTSRKKVLKFLYELAYRKEFYKAKISLIRDGTIRRTKRYTLKMFISGILLEKNNFEKFVFH